MILGFAAALLVAGCGETTGDRLASGALIGAAGGAAIGAMAGNPGLGAAAGAVAGGGLTVIANAPNPAGAALLKRGFSDESIGAAGLFLGASLPTLVAVAAFTLL